MCDVRDEYDNDEDNRLDSTEAMLLLWDIWRLLIASRDAGVCLFFFNNWLDCTEAMLLLRDIWRLLIASRDAGVCVC